MAKHGPLRSARNWQGGGTAAAAVWLSVSEPATKIAVNLMCASLPPPLLLLKAPSLNRHELERAPT
jgi:hypothetical protein